MARRLVNLLRTLSLLLCVAVVALWVGSMSRRYDLFFDMPAASVRLSVASGSFDGQLGLYRGREGKAWGIRTSASDLLPGRAPMSQQLDYYAQIGLVRWRVGGVALLFMADDPPTYRLYMPCWLPTATFMMPPSWCLIARQMKRLRRSRGLCPRCGYDLTRNVSGVCPECGSPSGPVAIEPKSGERLNDRHAPGHGSHENIEARTASRSLDEHVAQAQAEQQQRGARVDGQN